MSAVLDSIKQAIQILNREVDATDKELQEKTLTENVKRINYAKTQKKYYTDMESHYKKYILNHISTGESVDFPTIGLKASVSPKVSLSVDEEKLIYHLKELAKEEPEILNALEKKVVESIKEDELQKLLDSGKIPEELVMDCMNEKVSQILYIKKLKNGGKK